MGSLFDNLSDELFQILKGSGRTLTLYDVHGNKTYEPKLARRVFAEPDKMMVSVNEMGSDSEVKLYLSQSTDLNDVEKLITTLRQISTRYNVLFNVRKYGRDLSPKDFAYQTEPVAESSMWGSTKTSYQKFGNCKLIVRHRNPVREGVMGSRGRNILNLFVETKLGERFRFPVIHLSGARAFAQHLNQGGSAHDATALHIVELAEESTHLANVSRYLRHAKGSLCENVETVGSLIKERLTAIRSQLQAFSRPRGYTRMVEARTKQSSVNLQESHSDELHSEVSRLAEMLKIDSNHALAESLMPVALLTLGVHMNEQFNEMFHQVVTLEDSAGVDALVEALVDEYGYDDAVWSRNDNSVAFMALEAFEDATGYLNMVESSYQIMEDDDKFLAYAKHWYVTRNKEAGEGDVLSRDQESAAEQLADGLKQVLSGQKPANAVYPESSPGFTNAGAKFAFTLGLYLEPKAGMKNDALFTYISNIVNKLQEGKKLTQTEALIATKLVDMVGEPKNEEVDETVLDEISRFQEPDDSNYPGDREIEAAVEEASDAFDLKKFYDGYFAHFVENAEDYDDEGTAASEIVKSIVHSLQSYIEDATDIGVTPDVRKEAIAIFKNEIRPDIESRGWKVTDDLNEAATAEQKFKTSLIIGGGDVDVTVFFDYDEDDDSVGHAGGVYLNQVLTNDGKDILGMLTPEQKDQLEDYAGEHLAHMTDIDAGRREDALDARQVDEDVLTLVRPGQHVATDLGHGVVQGVNGRWADVEFMNGQVHQIHLGDLEIVESKLPEERELEEWFASFDPMSVLTSNEVTESCDDDANNEEPEEAEELQETEELEELEDLGEAEDLEESEDSEESEEPEVEILGGDKGEDFINDVKVNEELQRLLALAGRK